MAYTSEIEKLERRWNENPLGLTFAPLAEAYRKAGDHTRALELLEIGLAQHPNYVPAHIVRGRCHLDSNGDDAAELAFLRVVELDPENAIALRSLAEICERTGRVSEAVRRLETLIEVDRSNEEARHHLNRMRAIPASPTPPIAAALPVEQAAPQPAQPSEPPRVMEPVAPEAPIEAASESPPAEAGLSDISVYDEVDLEPGSASEFRLPSDSEALSPSGDRLPDVVLGSEITEHSLPMEHAAEGEGMLGAPNPDVAGTAPLPGAELAQEPIVPDAEAAYGGVLDADPLADDADSASAWAGSIFEPTMPGPDSPEAIAQSPSLLEDDAYLAEAREFAPAVEPEDEREPVDEAPAFADRAEDVVAAQEPLYEPPELSYEPAAVAEPERPAESASVPQTETAEPAEPPAWAASPLEHEPAGGRESPASPEAEAEPAPIGPEPALVVTESMAEVFLRQGHPELALAVYTQLVQRDPENRRVSDAASRLREELAPPVPPAPPTPRFDAASTGGTSIAARLAELFGATRPPVAASVHPPAFEVSPRDAEPTRPAEESLSLSSVFGEDAGSAPVGPASGPAESAEGEPSFDEFFAPQEAAELPSAPPPAPEAAGSHAQSGEDLERFNTWLRGLKG